MIGKFALKLITTDSELDALYPEWEALDASLSQRTPFTSPLWCITWWRHFRRNTFTACDQLRLYALRDPVGRLVAVAPMMLTSRPKYGPFRLRQMQFFGADTNITELRGPVCRPEIFHDVVERLHEQLLTQQTEWDWVQWRGVLKTPETVAWVKDRTHLRLQGNTPDFYVPLPANWAALNARLTRNMKEAIRKSYNLLARDGHSFEFRVLGKPEDMPDAISTFLDLHTARAELTGTIDHINAFATPHAKAFLHKIALLHAEQGRMRIFQLVIGGEVVATRLAFVCGTELYLYFSGYKPEWSKYSAMTTTVVEIMKWALQERFSVVNLSFGNDRSKLRWRPESCEYIGGFTVSNNLQAELLWPGFSAIWRRLHPAVSHAPNTAETEGARAG